MNDDPKFQALLKEIRELTSVANDRLLEIGAVACGPDGVPDSEDQLAQPRTRALFMVIEHRWDGSPSDPGYFDFLGFTDSIEDARRLLFIGEGRRHPDWRWRISREDRESIMERIQSESDERNIRGEADIEAYAREHAEEFTWRDFGDPTEDDPDESWSMSGGSKRWIETVTLP